MGTRWDEVAERYRDAQMVLPWSDIANFVITDRRRCGLASVDAERPVRTGDWSTAERASLSGEAILISTGGDGGWKVLVRHHDARPQDIPPGNSILCPLDAPTGELVVHCGSVAFGLPALPDPDDEDEEDVDDDEDPNEDIADERVLATVPPGRYLAQVTAPDFEDYVLGAEDDVRAPDYLIDLWPASSDPGARCHWRKLG